MPDRRPLTDVERLKQMPLGDNRDASDALQLLHLMLRAGRWAAYERPENFPFWYPKDAIYYFDHFFHKHVEEKRMKAAFLELQKTGLVRKTDGGYVLSEEA